ncbi:FAD-binding oxidoreductase [Pseudoalteromonas tunicata]|uniref:NAD(P)/FAD-dependent oxidoreductase n=1 Tax=Pseudoalteromonas tunicata TaxID=314281 RepID=UPI00273F3572|nr:FAD-binding oxidoreductase [Pseudoalteromonas tunicata]MDP5213335.1 FAD-binding oxidoreductase [Pseudoalteromonas tunicata]
MHYDPLISPNCSKAPLAKSYWASTLAYPPASAPLKQNRQVDVAIIGGGFTGLTTAYYLSTLYNIDCCVLEANQIGFGASGRNAGFVLKGSGRLSYRQMADKWGMPITQGIYHEFSQAVQRVEDLISEHQIDCDKQEYGYLKIAHNAKALHSLQSQSQFISDNLGGNAQFLTPDTLKNEYMINHQAYGALRLDDGFGINPLKLVLGYSDMVKNAGVDVFEQTLVKHWQQQNNHHTLATEHATITAKQVVCAGNAYNNKQNNSVIANRYLPILSNILVTRPLTEEELQATGIKTHQVTMDTRTLKYYYRLLPDNRILFGGRGAVRGQDQDKHRYQANLTAALATCFPILGKITVDYFWSGWIAAALDDMPHVINQNGSAYSIGYCGSGVAFSAQAGFRLAQQLAGEQVPALPLYQTPAPTFPFAQFRRLGQAAYYQYGWLKDKYF